MLLNWPFCTNLKGLRDFLRRWGVHYAAEIPHAEPTENPKLAAQAADWFKHAPQRGIGRHRRAVIGQKEIKFRVCFRHGGWRSSAEEPDRSSPAFRDGKTTIKCAFVQQRSEFHPRSPPVPTLANALHISFKMRRLTQSTLPLDFRFKMSKRLIVCCDGHTPF